MLPLVRRFWGVQFLVDEITQEIRHNLIDQLKVFLPYTRWTRATPAVLLLQYLLYIFLCNLVESGNGIIPYQACNVGNVRGMVQCLLDSEMIIPYLPRVVNVFCDSWPFLPTFAYRSLVHPDFVLSGQKIEE